MGELENNLEQERYLNVASMNALQGDISRLRGEMSMQQRDYQNLMAIRTALEIEVAIYRKLLQVQDTRYDP